MRLSHSSLLVLKACSDRAPGQMHGYELMQMTGIASGTLYPVLLRFEAEGLLTSSWETADPSAEGRPRRRLYRITGTGIHILAERLGALGWGAA